MLYQNQLLVYSWGISTEVLKHAYYIWQSSTQFRCKSKLQYIHLGDTVVFGVGGPHNEQFVILVHRYGVPEAILSVCVRPEKLLLQPAGPCGVPMDTRLSTDMGVAIGISTWASTLLLSRSTALWRVRS